MAELRFYHHHRMFLDTELSHGSKSFISKAIQMIDRYRHSRTETRITP